MIKREAGFTLVELLITMVVFLLVIAVASNIFTGLLTHFKQQSKIAETNIEGIIGLEILRQDIEHAGYGLPWNGLIAYSESTTNPFNLNDSTTTAPPRAIISSNDATFSSPNNIFNGSDYLVIKSVNVAVNTASQKWTTLRVSPFTAPYNPRQWTPAAENFENTDRVIVLAAGSTDANARRLIVSGSIFYTTFGNITNSPWPPADNTEPHLVYGINRSGAETPTMPFNRADYYIWRGGTTTADDGVPDRCALGTGILRKAVLNHSGTFQGGILPLLDCVADMQVVYRLNTGAYKDNISTLNAQEIREQITEVRVYILAHEGQRDVNYTYPNSSITVGEFGMGRDFNLTTIPNWQNYRWKIYTLVVKPNNLG
jgi:prepilin-type N-terminal cleavage/methylation domain-containing protein